MARKGIDSRLRRIEDVIRRKRLNEPPLMSMDERMEFVSKLGHDIVEGEDREIRRRYAKLDWLNKKAVGGMLLGFGMMGCFGGNKAIQGVRNFLAEHDARIG